MAQVYLDPGEKYKIINDDVQVFGHDGVEQVIIESDADNVVLGQNIERVDFAGDVSDFTFKAEGTQLQVFDKEGNKITEIGVQGDEDGTELAFTDGVVKAIFDRNAHAIKVGGADVPKDNPGAVEPVDIDSSDHSEASEVTTTAPQITISDVKVTEGNDGTQQATVVVTLSQTPAQGESVTVDWATQDGTATTADNDYAEASGTLTFGPGEVQKTITVDVNGDLNVEDDETFKVVLSNVTGQVQGQDVKIADDTGVVTIQNDDKAVDHYVLSADTTQVEEGNAVTFTLKAVDADGNEVPVPEKMTFSYNVSGSDLDGAASKGSADDVSPASGKVSIEAGKSSVSFTVTPIDDNTAEGMEGFKVTVLDKSLSAVDSVEFAVTDPSGTGGGTTYTLTDKADTVSGTLGDDTINGVWDAVTATNKTFQITDSINGDGGTGDVLSVTVIANGNSNTGVTAFNGYTVSGIEILKIYPIYGYADTPTAAAGDDLTVDASLGTFDKIIVDNPRAMDVNDTLTVSNVGSLDTVLEVDKGDKDKVDLTFEYDSTLESGNEDTAKISLADAKLYSLKVHMGTNIDTAYIDKAELSLSGSNEINSSQKLDFDDDRLTTLTITGDGSLKAAIDGFKNDSTIYKTIDASGASGDLTLTVAPNDSKYEFKGGSGTDLIIIDPTNEQTYSNKLKSENVEKILVDLGAGDNVTVNTSNLNGATVGVYADSDDTNRNVTFDKVADGSTIEIMGTGKSTADLYGDIGTLTINIDGASASSLKDNIAVKVYNQDVDLGSTGSTEYEFKELGTITADYVKNLTVEVHDADANFTGIQGQSFETITLIGDEDVIFSGTVGTNANDTLTQIDASQVEGKVEFSLVDELQKSFEYIGAQGADVLTIGDQDDSDGGDTDVTQDTTLTFNLGTGNDKITINDDIQDGNTIVKTRTFVVDFGDGNDTFYIDQNDNKDTTVEAGSIDFGEGDDTLQTGGTDGNGNTIDLSKVTLSGLENIVVSGSDTLKIDGDSVKELITNGSLDVTVLDGTLELALNDENDIDLSNSSKFNIQKAAAANFKITGNGNANEITGTAYGDTITGGAGADTLTGGAGNDIFTYTAANEFGDTIKDFATGVDKIYLDVSNSANGFLHACFNGGNIQELNSNKTGVVSAAPGAANALDVIMTTGGVGTGGYASTAAAKAAINSLSHTNFNNKTFLVAAQVGATKIVFFTAKEIGGNKDIDTVHTIGLIKFDIAGGSQLATNADIVLF